MVRLIDRVEGDIAEGMIQKFSYKNKNQVPRLEKIVINSGLGRANDEPKLMEEAVSDIALIAGQRPVVALSRKSIAGFKLRRGQKVGCFVTLRRKKMYDFMERLVRIYLPRVRDFRGLPPDSFDGGGNYTLGIKDQSIFPELDKDKIEHIFGLSITIVTTAHADDEARELLALMEMPFRKTGKE
jgi:large subunit ribosomal protein L5